MTSFARALAPILATALLWLTACTSETNPEPTPVPPARTAPAHVRLAPSKPPAPPVEEQPALPYIPETFDMYEEYPPLLKLAESNFPAPDKSRNNYTTGGASFYIDEAVFTESDTENEAVFGFESAPDSPIGYCFISIFSRPVETMNYLVREGDWSSPLVQVPTLNMALKEYLQRSNMEVYSYYSDRLGDMYIPGAMGDLTHSVGFLFFFTDNSYIYSIQLSGTEADKSYAQRRKVAELIASFVFEP